MIFLKSHSLLVAEVRYNLFTEANLGSKDYRLFHCGSSSKDAGNKITSIMEMRDKDSFKQIVDHLMLNEKLILK